MKFKIDNEALAQDFFEDTRLLGIVAPVKNYLFTWQLNNVLGLRFRLNNDIEIQLTKKRRKYFFPVYEYLRPASCFTYYLYCNVHEGEYLLPEFKHLDFLWLLKGDMMPDEELKELITSIRSINGVQLVNEMTDEKIKNKQHMVF
jgi:hypothetical protein